MVEENAIEPGQLDKYTSEDTTMDFKKRAKLPISSEQAQTMFANLLEGTSRKELKTKKWCPRTNICY